MFYPNADQDMETRMMNKNILINLQDVGNTGQGNRNTQARGHETQGINAAYPTRTMGKHSGYTGQHSWDTLGNNSREHTGRQKIKLKQGMRQTMTHWSV